MLERNLHYRRASKPNPAKAAQIWLDSNFPPKTAQIGWIHGFFGDIFWHHLFFCWLTRAHNHCGSAPNHYLAPWVGVCGQRRYLEMTQRAATIFFHPKCKMQECRGRIQWVGVHYREQLNIERQFCAIGEAVSSKPPV